VVSIRWNGIRGVSGGGLGGDVGGGGFVGVLRERCLKSSVRVGGHRAVRRGDESGWKEEEDVKGGKGEQSHIVERTESVR